MAERPLLTMPHPERRTPQAGKPPRESIPAADPAQQAMRVGPKFNRLEETLGHPELLGELRDDPAAIVPERALVFEVASEVVDFYRAVRGVPSLEFLGEDEGDAIPDDYFYVPDKDGTPRQDKRVPRRFYFTIPDQTALQELLSLWKRFQRGEELGLGRTAWRDVFGHLADIRPWGPRDRLSEEAIEDWRERLQKQPDKPVTFEVEFWYRDKTTRRETAETTFKTRLENLGGQILDSIVIDVIRYHAVLVRVSPSFIQNALDHPDVGIVTFDDIMMLRPQSMVSDPVEAALEYATDTESSVGSQELEAPVAALIDGVPMAQHNQLSGLLIIDDPDEIADLYGTAMEQRHGTAMASLILHGDLNIPKSQPSVRRQLYIRPVLYPQVDVLGSTHELMPPDRLSIDLIWRSFIRMFDGESGEPPTAPTVRVVNLSLGDAKRRFSGTMSPWARLIDYLSWHYGVLIIVSAGNILEWVPLEGVNTWSDFENIDSSERQSIMLRSIIRQRAHRRLLSPSESINALTIGAAHSDHTGSNGHAVFAVDPFENTTLPNLSSALGLGFKRTIKPEVLFPGGAEQVRANSNQAPISVQPVSPPANYFGIGVATPGTVGQTNRKINMSGTSVSTALATHNSIRILEALEDLPDDPAYPTIDPTYLSVLLKALLVHSARWDHKTAQFLKEIVSENQKLFWEHERDEISRFLGFGCPEIERVIDCAENRATLIGWNTIRARETDRFEVPLPSGLEGIAGFRALSVTIAWLTPITYSNRMYRLAKLKASPGGDKNFSIGVNNSKVQPSPNTLGKGTIYHHRWEGEKAEAFVDDGNLILDVTCLPVTGDLDDPIDYAVVTTLEVGVEVAIPIYESIRERLREAIRVKV